MVETGSSAEISSLLSSGGMTHPSSVCSSEFIYLTLDPPRPLSASLAMSARPREEQGTKHLSPKCDLECRENETMDNAWATRSVAIACQEMRQQG